MDIKKLEEMRRKVLAEIEEDFVNNLIPARLNSTDENENPLLAVLLGDSDEAVGNTTGEFFFLPSALGDDIQFFVNLFTLYEDIPGENLGELADAVAGINTYVTVGAFAIDPAAGSLIYKLVHPMSTEISEDALKDSVDLTMGCAFQAVKDYGYLLTEVIEGTRNAASVFEVIDSEL